MPPRDLAYRLLGTEAWRVEDRPQIVRDCLRSDEPAEGIVEAIDRAFMAGVELVAGKLTPDERARIAAAFE